MVNVKVVHLDNKQFTVTVAAETVGELLPLLEGEDGFGTGSVRKPDGTLLGPSQRLPPETPHGPATLIFKPKAGAASTSGQTGTGAGAGAQADSTADVVSQMMEALGLLDKVPGSSAELGALLTDRTNLKIPVMASAKASLQRHLRRQDLDVLLFLHGQNVTARLSLLIDDVPYDYGCEGRTTHFMQDLLKLLDVLGRYSGHNVLPFVQSNRTEIKACSRSSAVVSRMRPDTFVVYNSCTLMIGEDKEGGMLTEATRDIQQYVNARLPAAQYGSVPGILAYAASGTELQFMYIQQDGQVRTAGPLLDLAACSGRLDAVCAIVQCYRVMVAMARALPAIIDRMPLWKEFVRNQHTTVTLTPAGAIKTIERFKSFSQETGVTQQSIEAAYKVAAEAAQQQRDRRQKPFLVSAAADGGPVFSRTGLSVRTVPLGYNKHIETEADARHVARSCLLAAKTLHAHGVVHTDLRARNVVWLDDEHCMVIDLEHCRMAAQPLPVNVHRLEGWDHGTLEERDGAWYFTPASDLYQIGRLLQQLPVHSLSEAAHTFVNLLLSKRSAQGPLTADVALQHGWLTDTP